MASFTNLFGATLKGKEGNIDTVTALDGKHVAIYFSAHWCPPCRGFTPKLAEYYTESLKAKGMEVVFVSSDRSVEDFDSYYKEMPWLALPFEDRSRKDTLSKKFKVKGIPSFVILSKDGSVITTDGRSEVMADPTGERFPWTPKSFAEVIGDKFLRGKETVGKDALEGKTLGLYFSAHWCPPCRGFTPQLAAATKTYNEKKLPFQVIFVTADRDEEAFKGYFSEMQEKGGDDWLAIPFEDKQRCKDLGKLFDVSGYPTLVIIDGNGKVINANARGDILSDPAGDKFPWEPPLVGDLQEPEGIEESLSIAVLMEALPAEQQGNIMAQLEPVAKKYRTQAAETDEDPKYLFFAAKGSDGTVKQIRKLCSLGDALASKELSSDEPDAKRAKTDSASPAVQMVLFNLEEGGTYYQSDATEITTKVVEDFISAFESGSLKAKKVQK
jgi:nucleoredoxin